MNKKNPIEYYFWIILLATLCISAILFLLAAGNPQINKTEQYYIQIISYIITFSGIPIIYYLKQNYLNISQDKNLNLVFLIIALPGLLGVFSASMYYISGNKNLFITWCISVIFLFMNKPRLKKDDTTEEITAERPPQA